MIVLFFSCTRDPDEIMSPGSNSAQVTLSIQVPGLPRESSQNGHIARAMPADEHNITEVDVLLFKVTGGDFIGSFTGTNLQIDPSDASKRTFTVDITPGTYDLMVLANSSGIISSAGLAADMTRAEVSEKLTLGQTGKWDITGSDLFPFWGERQNAVITHGSSISDIHLNRAVAKIDIAMSAAVAAQFTLQTVAVYHWQNQMALIPDAGKMNGSEVTSATQTGTSLNLLPATGKMTYSGTDIDNGESVTSKIYLNETPNPGVSAFPVMPCVVVGGQLEGYTQPRYYRIDLYTVGQDDARNYCDLLRNHHYTITLSEILTNGSENEEDAYESTVVNIETSVKIWNESDLKNLIVDGEYWLRVDPAEFELAREAHTATPETRAERFSPDDYFFEIESNTDWSIDPNGIVYSPTNQTGWFGLKNRGATSDWSGAANTVADMEILVTENTSGEPRTATFTVEAGTIRFQVKVTQTPEEMVRLKVTVLESDFYPDDVVIHGFISSPHMQRTVHLLVEWFPESYSCEVKITDISEALEFVPGYGIEETTLQGGREMYELKFKPFVEEDFDIVANTYKRQYSEIGFTVGNQTKKIDIWHYMTDCRFGQSVYRMDIPGTMDLYLNLNLEVVSVDDPHEVLSAESRQMMLNLNTGWAPGYINDGVEHLSNSLTMGIPAPEKDGKKAYVTMRVKDFPYANIPDFVLEIEAYYLFPNSYMVPPGGSVHLPVRKAWRAWSQYPMNAQIPEGTMGCEVVWQDTGGLISEVTLTPVHSENDIDSEIFVRTGASEGNAVVALTMDGEIAWSWHIWVSDYDPEATNPPFRYLNSAGTTYTTFMSRNIGATAASNSSDVNKANSQGLLYQWGRKDPLPPVADINSSARRAFAGNHKTVYYPSGRQAFRTVEKPNWVDALEAFRYTIENPTTHINSTSGQYHWAFDETRLWYLNPGGIYYKTEFDPCPEGWRSPMASYPWGGGSDESATFFFVPQPSNSTNNFGYTRQDGYYMPATGFIDEEGYYSQVGFYTGSWSARRGTVTGETIDKGQTLRVQYYPETSNVFYGYFPQLKAWAQPVRCSRED